MCTKSDSMLDIRFVVFVFVFAGGVFLCCSPPPLWWWWSLLSSSFGDMSAMCDWRPPTAREFSSTTTRKNASEKCRYKFGANSREREKKEGKKYARFVLQRKGLVYILCVASTTFARTTTQNRETVKVVADPSSSFSSFSAAGPRLVSLKFVRSLRSRWM